MAKWRTYIVLFLIICFAGGIVYQLINLQVYQQDYYSALAQGQHNFFEEIKGERGEILAQQKNGELIPLATNNTWFLLFSCPNKIQDKEETALKLSKIVDLEKEEILDKILQDSSYIKLQKELDKETAEKIRELELKGIYLSKKGGRYYPYDTLASNILGFVGAEHNKGQYGVEEAYNSLLKGERGLAKGVAARGYLLDSQSADIKKGEDLILTIDFNIQSVAEDLLKKAKEEYGAEGGSITIMDPKTGKVLALATLPNFNPNKYEEYAKEKKMEVFQNSVTQKLYEPGSVFKPITMAAALNEEKIKPDTTYIDEGSIKINGWTIENYKGRKYGERTMTEVLKKSINTGAVFAQQKLDPGKFLEYIKSFGLFSKTEIGIPETNSENIELQKERGVNLATASFGQGIEITPIQLLRAFSAIANNGELVNPYLIKNYQNQKTKQIISGKTASKLTAMLVKVIKEGYGKKAQVPGYYIAGKTGTAQVPWSSIGINKSGYSDKTWQSFIGFAPAFNPRFLILVKLNNPNTNSAEESAAPTFKKMTEYLLNYYQVPPDYDQKN